MASTFGHQTGFLIGVNLPVMLGLKAVYQDIWDANTTVRLIAEEEVTMTLSATPFLMDLVRAPARQLPKTASGKVQRFLLRQQITERVAKETGDEGRNA